MINVKGKKYYTTVEIAKKIGVHKRTIQNWVDNGSLIPFKFSPKKFYFDEDAIEKCVRGGE
jgi:excisionase family DNA binding protein